MGRVLITGATGFVGTNLVQILTQRGITCRCLVRSKRRLDFLRPYHPEFVFGDVTQPETLRPAVESMDAVVHCAGLTKARSLEEYYQVNRDGTRHILEACAKAPSGPCQMVHISSLAALGPSLDGKPVIETTISHPVSHYGISKLAGHQVAESYMNKLPVTIIIPPAIYGPLDRDFLVYFQFIKYGFMPLIGRKTRYLSILYVKDLANAIADCLENKKAVGQSFLVDDGRVQTWESVAAAIGTVLGKNPRRLLVPESVARGIAGLAGGAAKLSGMAPLLNTQKMKELCQPSWACSSARIQTILGWKSAFSLGAGMEETGKWYTDNKWL
jgi:nucleoside-diphosphate-sugar epimerase